MDGNVVGAEGIIRPFPVVPGIESESLSCVAGDVANVPPVLLFRPWSILIPP